MQRLKMVQVQFEEIVIAPFVIPTEA